MFQAENRWQCGKRVLRYFVFYKFGQQVKYVYGCKNLTGKAQVKLYCIEIFLYKLINFFNGSVIFVKMFEVVLIAFFIIFTTNNGLVVGINANFLF